MGPALAACITANRIHDGGPAVSVLAGAAGAFVGDQIEDLAGRGRVEADSREAKRELAVAELDMMLCMRPKHL